MYYSIYKDRLSTNDLCLVWRIDNVPVLEILARHESLCLNGRSRMEEIGVLNRNQ